MAADIVALTAQGPVRGVQDGPALRFLGIPYAESPVTAGRFGAPAAPGRWDGIRDALSYGATSPQPDRGVTLIPEPIIAGDNELNLNVFTPDLAPARLPLLVWIHGGGFFGGGNASPWYRGGPFARAGVVLVSINYGSVPRASSRCPAPRPTGPCATGSARWSGCRRTSRPSAETPAG